MDLYNPRLIALAESLEEDEKTVMAQIERTRKTGNSRAFSEEELLKKKKCWSINNISDVLANLQEIGLVQQVDPGKKLWQATADGKMIEHYLNNKLQKEKSPGLTSILRRG